MEKALRIIFQNTVVDISPTSRYERGSPDTALITTTLYLEEPPDVDSLEELGDEGTTDVKTGESGRLVTLRSSLDIPGEDDWYKFRYRVPPPSTELIKNADFSLIVLLPRPAVYPTGPIFEVELRDYTDDPEPTVFGPYDLPALGNRIAAGWYGRQDPDVDLDYWYRKIRGST